MSVAVISEAFIIDMEDFGRDMVPTLVRLNARNFIRAVKFMKKLNLKAQDKGPVSHVYPDSHVQKVISHAEHVVSESMHHPYHHVSHHGDHFRLPFHHGFHHGHHFGHFAF